MNCSILSVFLSLFIFGSYSFFFLKAAFPRTLFPSLFIATLSLGVVHKWRHGLRGEGVSRFCDDSVKALVIKSVTMGGGGVKIIKYCVTSFMDDPLCVQAVSSGHFLCLRLANNAFTCIWFHSVSTWPKYLQ